MSKYRVSLNAIIWVVLSIFSVTMSILFVAHKGESRGLITILMPIFGAFTMPVFLLFKKKWLSGTIFGVLAVAAFAFMKYRDSLGIIYVVTPLVESYSFIVFNLIIIMIYFVKYLKSNVKLIVKGQNDT